MNEEKETTTVYDQNGFHYEVNVNHSPAFGFSTARYKGSIIADCVAYRITKPSSDDDLEWERYFDRFHEWRDEIMSTLKKKCEEHFNGLK